MSSYILTTGANSDGDATKRPSSLGNCTDDSQYYCQRIGRDIAKEQGRAEWQKYTIDRLPAGYIGLMRVRDESAATPVRDRYIYGHPKGRFMSVPQFLPHYKYLQEGDLSSPCPCDLCMGARNKGSGGRGRRKVNEPIVGTQYTTPVPGRVDAANGDVEMTGSSEDDGSTNISSEAEAAESTPNEEMFTFEFGKREQQTSAHHAKVLGQLCTKAQRLMENRETAAYEAYESAIRGAIYAGVARPAWYAMPEVLRIELLDDMRAHLQNDLIAESVKKDLRGVIQQLSSFEINNEAFYEHEDLTDANVAKEHVDTRDRVLDLILSEHRYKPFQSSIDCRDGVIALLESSEAPLALKFEVVCMFVRGFAGRECLKFWSDDNVLGSFIKQLTKSL